MGGHPGDSGMCYIRLRRVLALRRCITPWSSSGVEIWLPNAGILGGRCRPCRLAECRAGRSQTPRRTPCSCRRRLSSSLNPCITRRRLLLLRRKLTSRVTLGRRTTPAMNMWPQRWLTTQTSMNSLLPRRITFAAGVEGDLTSLASGLAFGLV